MNYFATGATGFVGNRLVRKRLERKGSHVCFLKRPERAGRVVGREVLRISIAPFDFDVDALHRISRQERVGGKCFTSWIWTRRASTGFANMGISFMSINMKLVRIAICLRTAQIPMNTGFRLFADGSAGMSGKGARDEKIRHSSKARTVQQMRRGVHF